MWSRFLSRTFGKKTPTYISHQFNNFLNEKDESVLCTKRSSVCGQSAFFNCIREDSDANQ